MGKTAGYAVGEGEHEEKVPYDHQGPLQQCEGWKSILRSSP